MLDLQLACLKKALFFVVVLKMDANKYIYIKNIKINIVCARVLDNVSYHDARSLSLPYCVEGSCVSVVLGRQLEKYPVNIL
jgi:hypothetical protein